MRCPIRGSEPEHTSNWAAVVPLLVGSISTLGCPQTEGGWPSSRKGERGPFRLVFRDWRLLTREEGRGRHGGLRPTCDAKNEGVMEHGQRRNARGQGKDYGETPGSGLVWRVAHRSSHRANVGLSGLPSEFGVQRRGKKSGGGRRAGVCGALMGRRYKRETAEGFEIRTFHATSPNLYTFGMLWFGADSNCEVASRFSGLSKTTIFNGWTELEGGRYTFLDDPREPAEAREDETRLLHTGKAGARACIDTNHPHGYQRGIPACDCR